MTDKKTELSNVERAVLAGKKSYIWLVCRMPVSDVMKFKLVASNMRTLGWDQGARAMDRYMDKDWARKSRKSTEKCPRNDTEGRPTHCVDTFTLLTEDEKVAKRIKGEISKAIKNKRSAGKVVVEQTDFENPNWRLTLGTINAEWKLSEGGTKVSIWFTDVYDFHPEKPIDTKCLHRIGSDLAKTGKATEYVIKGIKHEAPKEQYLDSPASQR